MKKVWLSKASSEIEEKNWAYEKNTLSQRFEYNTHLCFYQTSYPTLNKNSLKTKI